MQPLTVPGTLDSLALIREHIRAAAAEAGLDKKRAYRLELAVDEIATNIVNHGYREAGRTGDVVVRAKIDAHTLTITLEDTALPFDPRQPRAPGADRSASGRTAHRRIGRLPGDRERG